MTAVGLRPAFVFLAVVGTTAALAAPATMIFRKERREGEHFMACRLSLLMARRQFEW